MIFAILLLLTAFVIWYCLWGRAWLRDKPWMAWLYKSRVGEWVEIKVFKKSETFLFGRYLHFLGLLLTLLGFAGEIDWSLVAILTPDWIDPYLPLMPTVLNVIGKVITKLRDKSTLPIEVVAAPEAVKAALPEVHEAVQAKEAAVVAVKEATATSAP